MCTSCPWVRHLLVSLVHAKFRAFFRSRKGCVPSHELRGGGGGAGLLLTTRHHLEPTHPQPPHLWTPPRPLKRLAQIFFRAIGQSKNFFDAFGANSFRPKIFFGVSKNSAPLEEGKGGLP